MKESNRDDSISQANAGGPPKVWRRCATKSCGGEIHLDHGQFAVLDIDSGDYYHAYCWPQHLAESGERDLLENVRDWAMEAWALGYAVDHPTDLRSVRLGGETCGAQGCPESDAAAGTADGQAEAAAPSTEQQAQPGRTFEESQRPPKFPDWYLRDRPWLSGTSDLVPAFWDGKSWHYTEPGRVLDGHQPGDIRYRLPGTLVFETAEPTGVDRQQASLSDLALDYARRAALDRVREGMEAGTAAGVFTRALHDFEATVRRTYGVDPGRDEGTRVVRLHRCPLCEEIITQAWGRGRVLVDGHVVHDTCLAQFREAVRTGRKPGGGTDG